MKNYQLYQELDVARRLAEQAGIRIMEGYFGAADKTKTIKEDGTPVTETDKAANELIVQGLHSVFPQDGIISEELAPLEGLEALVNRVWYVDPLDGTSGFVYRSDQFAVHIGLAIDEEAVLGVVHKPTTGETYFGIKGQGAYLANRYRTERLRVSSSRNPESRVIVDKDTVIDPTWKDVFEGLQAKKIFTSGSEGLRIMKVAEGIANVHMNNGPQFCSTWDLCAPQIIATEAGAYFRTLDGSPMLYQKQGKIGKVYVFANNEERGEHAREVLGRFFA
ncbi:MAG: 3'(2'),5'-bisphosphate nucleotidase CysQ [bacterium]|nr:3'(2'),5'-bisphosphate nucleotidase CysQ [bacterium]